MQRLRSDLQKNLCFISFFLIFMKFSLNDDGSTTQKSLKNEVCLTAHVCCCCHEPLSVFKKQGNGNATKKTLREERILKTEKSSRRFPAVIHVHTLVDFL